MRTVAAAAAAGLRDAGSAPGLLLTALLHAVLASLVFGLAVSSVSSILPGFSVLDAAEEDHVVALRVLDPGLTDGVSADAVDTVPHAFAPLLDDDGAQGYLLTEQIAVEAPSFQGALFTTAGLPTRLGRPLEVDDAHGAYFAPQPLPGSTATGDSFLGGMSLRYAGPLPADAFAPTAEGALRPLAGTPVVVLPTEALAGLLTGASVAPVFGSLVTTHSDAARFHDAVAALEDRTGVVAEFTPLTTGTSLIAREARGASMMTVVYGIGLLSAIVTVVSLLVVLTRRRMRTWLAHLVVGAPLRVIGLRVSTVVFLAWTTPAAVGFLLGFLVAGQAGVLPPAPAVLVWGGLAILGLSAALAALPLLALRRAVLSGRLIGRTL